MLALASVYVCYYVDVHMHIEYKVNVQSLFYANTYQTFSLIQFERRNFIIEALLSYMRW